MNYLPVYSHAFVYTLYIAMGVFLVTGISLMVIGTKEDGKKAKLLQNSGLVSFIVMLAPLFFTSSTPVSEENLLHNLQQKYAIESITIDDIDNLRPGRQVIPTLITARLEDGRESHYLVVNNETTWEPMLSRSATKNPLHNDLMDEKTETTVPVEEITK